VIVTPGRGDILSGWIAAPAIKSGMNQVKINTSPITNVAIKNPLSH
jgi:hypothetical protein